MLSDPISNRINYTILWLHAVKHIVQNHWMSSKCSIWSMTHFWFPSFPFPIFLFIFFVAFFCKRVLKYGVMRSRWFIWLYHGRKNAIFLQICSSYWGLKSSFKYYENDVDLSKLIVSFRDCQVKAWLPNKIIGY